MHDSYQSNSNIPVAIEEINSIPIHFIIGVGRSGTSLLQSMLGMHPKVCAPLESRFVIHLHHKYSKVRKWDDTLIVNFIDEIFREFFIKNFWFINKDILIEKIKRISKEDISFLLLCKMVYIEYYVSNRENQTIKLIVDKNPPYIQFVDELLVLFPNAKFIHIIRDYRDNVMSRKKLFFSKNVNLLAEEWLIENKNMDRLKRIQPERFHTIRYEDLVKNPEHELVKITNFIGISFDKSMLNHQKYAHKIKTLNPNEFDYFHKELLKPINLDNLSKWKGFFAPKELNFLYYSLGEYARKYDYQQVDYPIVKKVFFQKLKAYLHYHFIRFVIRFYYNWLPMPGRKLLSNISKKLFTWFKYTNYYNYYDYNHKAVSETK